MGKPRASDLDSGQLPLVGLMELVPIGDYCFRAVPQKPVLMASISQAAKATRIPHSTIYRLYKAGFIRGDHVSPKKIRIDMASLHAYCKESAGEDVWTPERLQRFQAGGAAGGKPAES